MDDYERRIMELHVPFTWPIDNREREIVGLALALAGEAGEFANKVKKLYLRGGTRQEGVTLDSLIDELGDIQAYSAMLATNFEITLADVRVRNLEKLEHRKRLRDEGKAVQK